MTPSIKCATIYDSISIANSIKFRDPMWCPSLLAWLMTYRLLSTQQLCQSMSPNGYSEPNKLTSMIYETQWFSFTKMHIYQPFANCYPFCSGVNVFILPTLYRNRAICCWSRHNKPIITEPITLRCWFITQMLICHYPFDAKQYIIQIFKYIFLRAVSRIVPLPY